MVRRRPVTSDLIRLIIARVMAENNLEQDDIPEEGPFDESMIADKSIYLSKRYFLEKAQAGFICGRQEVHGVMICPRQWSSHQASAVIDLYDQTVVWVGEQRCHECYLGDNNIDHDAQWASPIFGEKAIEKMATLAVESCLVQLGRRPYLKGRGRKYLKKPHHERHCKLCKILKRRCC